MNIILDGSDYARIADLRDNKDTLLKGLLGTPHCTTPEILTKNAIYQHIVSSLLYY